MSTSSNISRLACRVSVGDTSSLEGSLHLCAPHATYSFVEQGGRKLEVSGPGALCDSVLGASRCRRKAASIDAPSTHNRARAAAPRELATRLAQVSASRRSSHLQLLRVSPSSSERRADPLAVPLSNACTSRYHGVGIEIIACSH